MLRHLQEEAGRTECWGCDIHAEAIHWAQAHFPHFNFFVNTTTPHLPFQDGYFNVIYAGSVFTHIGELDDFWLLELRRILRPLGRLYITLSNETTLKIIRETRPDHPSSTSTSSLQHRTSSKGLGFSSFRGPAPGASAMSTTGNVG